jgi:hypothetical protein
MACPVRFTPTACHLSSITNPAHRSLASMFQASTNTPHLVASGLDFTAQALRHNVTHPKEELSTSFREAYSKTLKAHHSFLIKPIFSAAMSACPYRKDFYTKLGSESGPTKEMEEWLEALEKQVGILNAFLAKEGKW